MSVKVGEIWDTVPGSGLCVSPRRFGPPRRCGPQTGVSLDLVTCLRWPTAGDTDVIRMTQFRRVRTCMRAAGSFYKHLSVTNWLFRVCIKDWQVTTITRTTGVSGKSGVTMLVGTIGSSDCRKFYYPVDSFRGPGATVASLVMLVLSGS